MKRLADRKSVAVWITAFVGFVLTAATGTARTEKTAFLDDPQGRKFAVILVGAAVNDEKANDFGTWALDLRTSLQKDYGYSAGNIRLLMGTAEEGDFNADGPCREESIRQLFKGLAGQIETTDQLNVFLFGHGTGRGDQAKFNIVGPDITGEQFAQLLEPIKTSDIVVINTTSASHGFSKALAGNGRVVVSATRSAAEKYDTIFPAFFVEALQGQAADRDKNRRVSILEAFDFTRARVEDYYRERGSLPSEHASLDDNGDGVLSVNPDRRGDGQLAEIAYLDVISDDTGNLSSEAAQLRTRMSNLERDIFLLRANKSALDQSEYWAQLEPLLIELAKVTRDFNAL